MDKQHAWDVLDSFVVNNAICKDILVSQTSEDINYPGNPAKEIVRTINDNTPIALEAFHESRKNKKVMQITDPIMGTVSMKYIEVNIVPEAERESQRTIYLSNGSITPSDNLHTLAITLAASGYRVVSLPHVLDKDTTFLPDEQPISMRRRDQFIGSLYAYEEVCGAFSSEAVFLSQLIHNDAVQNNVQNIELLGNSAGGPIMMRIAAQFCKDWDMCDRIKMLHLVSPAGCFPLQATKGWQKVKNIAKMGYGLLSELNALPQTDPLEDVLATKAAGETEHRKIDIGYLAARCVTNVFEQTMADINVRVNIFSGANDNTFPFEMLNAAVAGAMQHRNHIIQRIISENNQLRAQIYKLNSMGATQEEIDAVQAHIQDYSRYLIHFSEMTKVNYDGSHKRMGHMSPLQLCVEIATQFNAYHQSLL
jgi:pimeloyl-ACP methyl ester carboxylesterase